MATATEMAGDFQILKPASWPRPSGYSNGIAVTGRQIFVAGQIGWDSQCKFNSTKLADQVRQALKNICAVLGEAQAGPEHIVRLTWIPAMVPWRASEDGFVTPEVLEWYGCFARGRPGAIVVEATGIRDVPSGPLLRAGHDRFLPGLRDLVRVVREASGGHTRLFIQLIDFLSIRRRPDPTRYFEQFLVITPRHRSAFGRTDADDAEIRAWLPTLPRTALEKV